MKYEAFSLNDFLDHDGAKDHDLDLNLSVKCVACDGRTKVVDFTTDTVTPCEPCAGTGYRLTYNGWDLIRFVAAFAAHPDAQATDYDQLQE